ncbi:MAG: hypothetical protein AAB489_05670 [Patescibacteria group bacterium]
MIPAALFILFRLDRLVRLCTKKIISLPSKIYNPGTGLEMEIPEPRAVFLLAQFLVQYHKPLLPLVDAPKAILAPDAIHEECAVAAPLAIFGKTKVVATYTIDAFVAPLILVAVAAIDEVAIEEEAIAVVAVFVVVSLRNQVTVLQVSGAVHVVAIFHRPADHKLPLMGDFL